MRQFSVNSKVLAVLALSAVLTSFFSIAPVQAATSQPRVVSANPANFTPQLPLASNTATHAFAQVGNIMYAGGEFTSIGGAPRNNIAAFNATDGTLSSFNPNVNGRVWSITPTSDGQLIIGGTFTSVNGVARRGLAKVTAAGSVNSTFNANLNGNVYDTHLVNGRVIASGAFTKKLAAFDPNSGGDTGYINIPIAGTVASNAGLTHVYRFAVRAQGDRLVGIGNFTTVGGQARSRAFMLDLGTTSATLSSWRYSPLEKMCAAASEPSYLRGVDFAPDGTYFVMVSTGFVSVAGDIGSTICDAAARFETNTLSPTTPTWINYTGGDTLHSVAITGAAVYVGGHNRWLNNPQGADTCGVGCVPRPGIGAIDPSTGKALSWNPMRTRGVGAKALYVTPAGLWVGSDTGFGGKLGCSNPGGPNGDDCTGQPLEQHAGIGFLPLN